MTKSHGRRAFLRVAVERDGDGRAPVRDERGAAGTARGRAGEPCAVCPRLGRRARGDPRSPATPLPGRRRGRTVVARPRMTDPTGRTRWTAYRTARTTRNARRRAAAAGRAPPADARGSERPAPDGRRVGQAFDRPPSDRRGVRRAVAGDAEPRHRRGQREGRRAGRRGDRRGHGRQAHERAHSALPPATANGSRRRGDAGPGGRRVADPGRGRHDGTDRRRDGGADGGVRGRAHGLRYGQGGRTRRRDPVGPPVSKTGGKSGDWHDDRDRGDGPSGGRRPGPRSAGRISGGRRKS